MAVKRPSQFKGDGVDLGAVPLGVIVFWYKGFTGVGSIMPYGYLECNGQVVSDVESPLNGQTLPDLNTGAKRFLRGSTTAGTLAGSDAVCHTHAITAGSGSVQSGAGAAVITSVTSPTGGTAPNTVPAHMEAVPIMRIK